MNEENLNWVAELKPGDKVIRISRQYGVAEKSIRDVVRVGPKTVYVGTGTSWNPEEAFYREDTGGILRGAGYAKGKDTYGPTVHLEQATAEAIAGIEEEAKREAIIKYIRSHGSKTWNGLTIPELENIEAMLKRSEKP